MDSKKNKSFMDSVWSRLRQPDAMSVADPDHVDPIEAERKAESFGRGALGNTGLGEKLAGKLLDATRDPSNTYAGSTGDTLDKSARNASAAYPTANRIGSEAVATPATVAAAPMLPAGGLAAEALGQAALSGAHGAYTAPEGSDRLAAAARGAATGAAMPLAGAAAKGLGSRLSQLRPPAMQPATATATADRGAGMQINMREPGAGPDLAGPAAVRGRPTVPPQAVSPEAESLVRSERDRRFIRPPQTDEALDHSMLTEPIPDAKLPIETKYRSNDGPNDLQPHENWSQRKIRGIENGALAKQARGGAELPPERLRNGQSMFDADQHVPSTSMNPTTHPEYAPEPRMTRPYDEADPVWNEISTVKPGPGMSERMNSLPPPKPIPSDAPTIMPGALESKIPSAQKPLVSESMLPEADRVAKYADVVHGKKMLGQHVPEAEAERYTHAKERLRGDRPRANEADYAEQPKTMKPARRGKKPQ